MNIFDALIVILSIVELSLQSSSANPCHSQKGSSLSTFRTIRIFRIFRVLRVTKVLRFLNFMKVIMRVLANSIDSFIYIALLLFLFIFIYSLLGMQLYGGKFNFDDNEVLIFLDLLFKFLV